MHASCVRYAQRCQMPEYATSQLCVPRRVDQLARPLNAWSLGLFPSPWHPLVHQPSRATLAPLLLFSFLNDDRTDRTDRLTHARLLERQPSAHSWRDTADPALPSTLERPLSPFNKTPTTRTGFVPSHFSFFYHLLLATVSPLFALCNTPLRSLLSHARCFFQSLPQQPSEFDARQVISPGAGRHSPTSTWQTDPSSWLPA